MTTHPEIEQLSSYVDGELSATEVRELEAHTPGCAECTRTLKVLRATLSDLAALPEPVLDEISIAVLDRQIAAERAVRRSFARRWGVVSGAAAAAVVALLVFAAVVRESPLSGTAKDAASLSGGAARTTLLDATATDYTEESLAVALTMFDPEGFFVAKADAPQQGAPAGAGIAVPERDAFNAYSEANAGARLDACTQEIERANTDVSPVRYESARFKGQPAFVLFFTRPRENPTYAEVWVVRPSDCFTLYYAQSRL